jgi:hypothetical protein
MSSFLIFIFFYFLNQIVSTSQQAIISAASIKVQLSHIENFCRGKTYCQRKTDNEILGYLGPIGPIFLEI